MLHRNDNRLQIKRLIGYLTRQIFIMNLYLLPNWMKNFLISSRECGALKSDACFSPCILRERKNNFSFSFCFVFCCCALKSALQKMRYVCCETVLCLAPVRLLNQCNSIIYVCEKGSFVKSCSPSKWCRNTVGLPPPITHSGHFVISAFNIKNGWARLGCYDQAFILYAIQSQLSVLFVQSLNIRMGIKAHGIIFAPN